MNSLDYSLDTESTFVLHSYVLARSEAARYLIEQDAPVGVYDDKGTPCLSLMIEKMPDIALEAIEQFHKVSLAFRKHYYYLNYMEKDRKFLEPESKPKNKKSDNGIELEPMIEVMKGEKKEKSFGKTPLEVWNHSYCYSSYRLIHSVQSVP